MTYACVLSALIFCVQDPAITDSDKYHVILENDQTRVLDYTDHPGDITTFHHHPNSVVYVLSDFERKLSFPDGSFQIKSLKVGDVFFLPDQIHRGENIGTTDTHVLLVEFKQDQTIKDPKK